MDYYKFSIKEDRRHSKIKFREFVTQLGIQVPIKFNQELKEELKIITVNGFIKTEDIMDRTCNAE